MMDFKTCSMLEDIHFKYERLRSEVSCLWMLLAEGSVDVVGLQEHALEYSLYEINEELNKNNNALKKILEDTQMIKVEVAS